MNNSVWSFQGFLPNQPQDIRLFLFVPSAKNLNTEKPQRQFLKKIINRFFYNGTPVFLLDHWLYLQCSSKKRRYS